MTTVVLCALWLSAFLLIFFTTLWVTTPRMHQRVLLTADAMATTPSLTTDHMTAYELDDPFEVTLRKIQANVLLSLRDRFPDVDAPSSSVAAATVVTPNDPQLLQRTLQTVALLDRSAKLPELPRMLLDTPDNEKAQDRLVRALGIHTVPSMLS